ncbi:MAG: tyrosine-type recombinase/integrase [Dehalococcoidia bacterium]
MSEVAFQSATELTKAIRDRRIGSAELLELYIERYERLNPKINAIVAIDLDAARSRARQADEALAKGRKQAHAPFGELSRQYLQEWLAQYDPRGGNIWGLNPWGIASMLRRLKEATGLPCNPHTFRRTFACLLRKAGVDTMTIKDLGRWESLEMVQRYTRSVNFQDSMRFYKAPLS